MTREQYAKLYRKYSRMPDNVLNEQLTDLFNKRYINNDINVFEEHRIAARVRIERNRTGSSLVFHLKEFQVNRC